MKILYSNPERVCEEVRGYMPLFRANKKSGATIVAPDFFIFFNNEGALMGKAGTFLQLHADQGSEPRLGQGNRTTSDNKPTDQAGK